MLESSLSDDIFVSLRIARECGKYMRKVYVFCVCSFAAYSPKAHRVIVEKG